MKKSNKVHEIDFISSYNRKNGKNKNRFAFLKEYRLLLITSVIMIVLSGGSFIYKLVQEHSVNSLNEQIEDPDFVAKYNEVLQLEEKSNALLTRNNELDDLIKALATYPKASRSVDDKLTSLATSSTTVEITAYNSSTGVLSFTATSQDNMQINGFIQNLSDSNLFSNVTYSGYSYQSDKAVYSIHVQCYLASNAGRGDQGE